ncbi:hypothetical protein V8G54_034116 [Vigna mungo]|uniref:Allantoinase n=1 Tax=Vigna mungo TaxID=3915 RepID=A0AAQ3RH00_VIGMU
MEQFVWRVLPLLTFLISFLVFFYLHDSYRAQLHPLVKLTQNKCSLLHHRHFWITSKRIVTPQGIISGSVEIKEGKIISVTEGYGKQGNSKHEEVIDYGDAVVMPGLIDVHVHLDEPGRTAWEGFDTGTRAAAAGGVTTIVDMPLNNHPTTVSKETLKLKVSVIGPLEAAENRIYVDVGFWGGLIPENALNKSILEGLLSAGVLGLKVIISKLVQYHAKLLRGISDFPMTTIHHIKEGLSVLAKYRRPLYVHSEIQQHFKKHLELNDKDGPRTYLTYLHSRPPSWEEAAIKELVGVTKDTRTGGPLEGAHVHVAHLSDSSASLDLIKEAKSRGDSISVETCPHYLAFSSEEIPNGDTRFKCSPPIRDAYNREKLWKAVLFDLPVTWSYGKKHGLTLEHLSLLWSKKPATFAGIESKGSIAVGNHADIVVWKPEVEFELNEHYPVFLKHPSLSAYMGRRLSGKVLETFVRGNLVFKKGKHAPAACGVPILAK